MSLKTKTKIEFESYNVHFVHVIVSIIPIKAESQRIKSFQAFEIWGHHFYYKHKENP